MADQPRAVLTVRVEGQTWSDLHSALAEVMRHVDNEHRSAADSNDTGRYSMEVENADALDWQKREEAANRAAAALQSHYDDVNNGMGLSYGDECSDTFKEAVIGLLTDLKHLLYRADPDMELTKFAETAVDRWAADQI